MDGSLRRIVRLAFGVTALILLGRGAWAQQIIYVNGAAAPGGNGASWATAFNDLHDGLAAASALPEPRDVEVWVTGGTYKTDSQASGDRNVAFIVPSRCAMRGGFIGGETSPSQRPPLGTNATVLDGFLMGGGVGARVVARLTIDASGPLEMDRLRFTGANAGATSAQDMGEGAVTVEGGAGRFIDCEFLDNRGSSAAAYGPIGGMGGATFIRCVIDGNSTLGVPVLLAPGLLVDCRISNNSVQSGPILSNFARLERCRLEDNSGGFGCFGFGFDVNMTVIQRNACEGDAGLTAVFLTTNTLTRSLFAANRVIGGTDIDLSAATVSHSTIVLSGGGANKFPGGRLRASSISNSVVSAPWNCDPPILDCAVVAESPPGTVLAEWSFVQSLPFQSTVINPNNCITGDPMLDNTMGYRPMPGSPVIDAGCDNSGGFVDEYDFDNDGDTGEIIHVDYFGNPRLIDDPFRPDTGCAPFPQANADMGYAEHVPVCLDTVFNCPGIVRDWLRPLDGDFNSDPNWTLSTPDAQSPARFRVDGAYEVTFSRNESSLSLEVADGDVTFDLDSRRYDLVSLNGASLRVGGNVSGGAATLSVVGGGTLGAIAARIGEAPGSVGTLALSGTGTRLSMPLGSISIGTQGDGTLSISGGATARAQIVTLGEFPGSFGTVTVSGPGSKLSPRFGMNILNGVATVQDGGAIELEFGDLIILQSGTVAGDGAVRADVVNFGTIAPSLAPGSPSPYATLTLNGDYEQVGVDSKKGAFSGSLKLDVGPTGTQADRLQVNGVASLAGGLFISLPPGVDPPVNTSWSPVSATLFPPGEGGRPNQFDVAFFPGLNGRLMRLTYPGPFELGGAVQVSVVPFSAPPAFNSTNYAFPGVPTAAELADFDSDGDVDLAVTIPNSNPALNGEVVLLLNAGTAPGGQWNGYVVQQQTITVGRFPSGLDSFDLDGDNDRDIVVVNRDDDSVQILGNAGAAVFSAGAAFPSGGDAPEEVLAAPRLVGGATPEIIVANAGSDHLRVFRNTGGGSYVLEPYALLTGDQPVDVVALDADGDGDNDLATADFGSGEVSVFASGTVQPPGVNRFTIRRAISVDTRPVEIEPGGLDNPKDQNDLAVVCLGPQGLGAGAVAVLRNIRAATSAPFDDPASMFAPAVNLPVGGEPQSLAILDLDADGPDFDADIAVVAAGPNPGERVARFLRNDTNGGSQLGFALVGTVPGSPTNVVLARAANVGGTAADDLVTINSDIVLRPGAALPDGADELDSRGAAQKVRVLENSRPGVPVSCPGDFSGDRLINTVDLVFFLGRFGQAESPPGTGADLNGDGAVNTADLVSFLGLFGTPCP